MLLLRSARQATKIQTKLLPPSVFPSHRPKTLVILFAQSPFHFLFSFCFTYNSLLTLIILRRSMCVFVLREPMSCTLPADAIDSRHARQAQRDTATLPAPFRHRIELTGPRYGCPLEPAHDALGRSFRALVVLFTCSFANGTPNRSWALAAAVKFAHSREWHSFSHWKNEHCRESTRSVLG